MDEQWEEERASEEEMAEMEAKYHFWRMSQDERDMPPHKRGDYLEKQLEQADLFRKAMREM